MLGPNVGVHVTGAVHVTQAVHVTREVLALKVFCTIVQMNNAQHYCGQGRACPHVITSHQQNSYVPRHRAHSRPGCRERGTAVCSHLRNSQPLLDDADIPVSRMSPCAACLCMASGVGDRSVMGPWGSLEPGWPLLQSGPSAPGGVPTRRCWCVILNAVLSQCPRW